MIEHPQKLLVFSSESDDSIGFQIYRLLYDNYNHDLIFLEGEYTATKEVKNYILPGDDGEDVFVNAEELIGIFEEVENTEKVSYNSLGMFYDYDLGFEFTPAMIEEIVSEIEPVEVIDDLRNILGDFSYLSQNWSLIDWEKSKKRIIENLNFVIQSENDFNRIEATILESAEFKEMVYPEIFELLLSMADFYDQRYVYVRTNSKVFCIKTDNQGSFPHFIYDMDDINLEEDSDTKILDVDATILNDWYDRFINLEDETEIIENE